jgi:ZIP family zinc transporter
VLIIGAATGAATLLGGALALRLRSEIGLFLSFSAGAVLGVALFDLLPEAFELSGARFSPLDIITAMAIGFTLYLVIDRTATLMTRGSGRHRRYLGPGSLTLHSLMDGLGIGLSFQVSSAVGAIVALAVLTHDFLDGANTVIVSLSSGAGRPTARRWLIADAIVPLIGICVAGTITVPAATLGVLLALFAGFFLYIGASDLLPRGQDQRPRFSTLAATVLGLGLIYGVVRLSGLGPAP